MQQSERYRWYLCRDTSGRVFVLHEANVPAGGRISQIELGDFLARGHGPEQQALVQMIGSLTEPAPAEKVENPGEWSTGMVAKGESKVVTFSKPGIHYYICTPHPWMYGQIIVE